MEQAEVLRVLSALAHPTRMRVLLHLIEIGDAGMSSGDIADAANVPRNLMSSHLAILHRAGVIAFRKSGRRVVYTAVAETVREVIQHLQHLLPATESGRVADQADLD